MEKENYLNQLPETLKAIIGKHFDYSTDFDFLDRIALIFLRSDIDDEKINEWLNKGFTPQEIAYDSFYFEEIESSLCSSYDQWVIMAFYQTPEEADLPAAYDCVENDFTAILEEYAEAIKAKRGALWSDKDDKEDHAAL